MEDVLFWLLRKEYPLTLKFAKINYQMSFIYNSKSFHFISLFFLLPHTDFFYPSVWLPYATHLLCTRWVRASPSLTLPFTPCTPFLRPDINKDPAVRFPQLRRPPATFVGPCPPSTAVGFHRPLPDANVLH